MPPAIETRPAVTTYTPLDRDEAKSVEKIAQGERLARTDDHRLLLHGIGSQASNMPAGFRGGPLYARSVQWRRIGQLHRPGHEAFETEPLARWNFRRPDSSSTLPFSNQPSSRLQLGTAQSTLLGPKFGIELDQRSREA